MQPSFMILLAVGIWILWLATQEPEPSAVVMPIAALQKTVMSAKPREPTLPPLPSMHDHKPARTLPRDVISSDMRKDALDGVGGFGGFSGFGSWIDQAQPL